MKRSGRPRKTTFRTDRKIGRILQENPFLSSTEIKRSVPELDDVSLKTIRHRLKKDLKLPARKALKNRFLLEKWPRNDLNSATSTKVGQVKTGRRSCFQMSQLFYSLRPTRPSSEDLLDRRQ